MPADGGTLACLPEPGPTAASCDELVPGSLGTPLKYRFTPNKDDICGPATSINGEGAFAHVNQHEVDHVHHDSVSFVSAAGEIVSTVPQDALVWPTALAGGFLVQRFNREGEDFVWTLAWYTSSGSGMANPVVVRSPERMLVAAVRPGGTGSAILVSSEDRSSGLVVSLQDASGRAEASGRIALPDSTSVRGETSLAFDSVGNLLVAAREVPRDRFNDTPERWAGWWIGPDGVASARFDLFGSRLDEAGLLLSGFAPLSDGRLSVDTWDEEGEQHEWRWTVSRTGGVQPAPCWLTQRPDSLVQWIRGGRGYLVSQDSWTLKRIEILTTTGESCGRLRDFCPPCENDWPRSTIVGLDGSLLHGADPNTELDAGTCGVNWYPGAFR